MNINKVLVQYEPYFKRLLYKEFRAFKNINLLMDMDDALQEFRIKLWQTFEKKYDPEKYAIRQFVFGFSPHIAMNVRTGIVKNMTYTGKPLGTRSQQMKLQFATISFDNPRAANYKHYKHKRDREIANIKMHQVFSSDDQINELLYYRKV